MSKEEMMYKTSQEFVDKIDSIKKIVYRFYEKLSLIKQWQCTIIQLNL